MIPSSSLPSLRRVDALGTVGTCTICDIADLPRDCPLAGRTTWPLHCGQPVAVLVLGDCRCPGDPIDLRAACYATAIAAGDMTYDQLSHFNILVVRGVLYLG